jgi:16S rRNA (cytidine1402-2'-O)-methyltransferase
MSTFNSDESHAADALPGQLFLVATPIGNLEDITFRAVRILKEADLIACEDTRRTGVLLAHYSIHTELVSYHEHNELTRAPELVLRMERGASIALVSDAGMPIISDPGHRLVKLAIRHNIRVTPIPGASAFVAALAAAGLPAEPFRFLGFLPSKKSQRIACLRELADAREVLIFYEAPHRTVEMIRDVLAIFGDPAMVVGREVTKVHEEFIRGRASEVLASLAKKPVKGELTIILDPREKGDEKPRPASAEMPLSACMAELMAAQHLSEREALKALAKASGIPRSELYRRWQLQKRSS